MQFLHALPARKLPALEPEIGQVTVTEVEVAGLNPLAEAAIL